MLLVILIIFAGYFLYNLKLEESPRWTAEDIAPQKYDSPALREKESFTPGIVEKNDAKNRACSSSAAAGGNHRRCG